MSAPYYKTLCAINQTSNDVLSLINSRRRDPLKLESDLCRLAKEAVNVQLKGLKVDTKGLSHYYRYAPNTLVFANTIQSNKSHSDFPNIILEDLEKAKGFLFNSLLTDRVDYVGLHTEFPSEGICVYAVIAYKINEFPASIKGIIDKIEGKCNKENILGILNSILQIIQHKPLEFNDELKRSMYNQAQAIHDDKNNLGKVVEILNSTFKDMGNFVILPIKSNDAKAFIKKYINDTVFRSFLVSDIDQIAFDAINDSDGQLYCLLYTSPSPRD